MLNLINVDLYKLFRMKSFYIIAAIVVFFAALPGVIAAISIKEILLKFPEVAAAEGFVPDVFSSMMTYLPTQLVMFISIMTILFFCSDFSNGTIKNIASKGFSRECIYFSKYICTFFITVIYFVLYILTYLLPQYFIIGNLSTEYFKMPTNFLSSLFLVLLLNLAYNAVHLFIASLLRRSGVSIAASYGLTVAIGLLPILSELLTTKLNWKIKLEDYTLDKCLTEVPKYLAEAFPSDVLTKTLLVAAGWFVIVTALGIYLFRKRDI